MKRIYKTSAHAEFANGTVLARAWSRLQDGMSVSDYTDLIKSMDWTVKPSVRGLLDNFTRKRLIEIREARR